MSTSINRDLRIFSLREVEKIHDAAFLAGCIKQAEEDERIVAREGENFWTDEVRRHYRIACAAIRTNADRLRAEGEGEPK